MDEAAREILPGVWRWQRYSPEHKVDLTSHAVLADGALWIFDPVFSGQALSALGAMANPKFIVLTNENHERDTQRWQHELGAPIWASAEAGFPFPHGKLDAATAALGPWRLSFIKGAAKGETAFGLTTLDLVLFGDAIVNLPGRGLEVLPAKYCRDQALLKREIAELLQVPFATALMAHGDIIAAGASEHLRALLARPQKPQNKP